LPEKIHRNSLKPGHRLHWYKISKILGQGGFGITYLAHDINLDKDVAIKEYLPIEMAVREGDFSVHPVSEDHGKQYKWGLDRFITEARTLAKFNHPNIVRVFSVFEENNTGYMVMQYEHGASLQAMLAGRKTMEEADLLKILIPILGGLEQIHRAGFIHRDIKPDNIFIREDGSPVLLDFGSARHALGEKTKTLTSLVTPGYAPFEQYYSKSDEQGPWTDIYGLGATLYRAVTGVAPLDALDRSKAILEASHDTVVSAAEIGRGKYSERFLNAIDYAIRFRIQDRPQSLAEWKREFGVSDELAHIEAYQREEQQVTQPGTSVIRKKPASRWLPVVVPIMLVILGFPLIYLYQTTQHETQPTPSPVKTTITPADTEPKLHDTVRSLATDTGEDSTYQQHETPVTLPAGQENLQPVNEPKQQSAQQSDAMPNSARVDYEPQLPPTNEAQAGPDTQHSGAVAQQPPNFSGLNYQQMLAIQTACARTQGQDQQLYYNCMVEQLRRMQTGSAPPAPGDNTAATQAQAACAFALGQGQEIYMRCLKQYASYNNGNGYAEDSGDDEDDYDDEDTADENLEQQILTACAPTMQQGPMVYLQCLYNQQQAVYAGYNTAADNTTEEALLKQIQTACAALLSGGQTVYNQCLYEQLEKLEEGNY